MLGHGARVLPLELMSVPGHGAQICARAPIKGYVQTSARARALRLSEAEGNRLRIVSLSNQG